MGGNPKEPNVLVFIADALRADRLHCYGNRGETSPAIDRLASEGVLFKQMIAHSANTMPCVVSAFTGLDPVVHGLTDPRTHSSHDWLGRENPFDFLDHLGYAVAGQDDWVYFHLGRHEESKDEAEALAFIEEHGDGPFFLWRIPDYTHLPYDPPPPYDTLFLPADFSLSAAAKERLAVVRTKMIVHKPGLISKFEEEQSAGRAGDTWCAGIEREDAVYQRSAASLQLEPEDRPGLAALYDGEVRALDDEIGRCVGRLEELGILEDTIVVVTGDHGEELLERGAVGHTSCSLTGTLYDEAIHVPFIVRFPKSLPRGAVVETQVSQCDIMPTLFDLMGIAMPGGVQGRSLLPLAKGGTAGFREETFATTLPCGWQVRDDDHRVIWCVRTPDWKLIHLEYFPAEPDRFELFDLKADPGETVNVFSDHPRVAEDLRKRLRAWINGGPSRFMGGRGQGGKR